MTGNDNIFNITLERATELLQGVQEKPQAKTLGKNKDGNDIVLSSGRYGPYIKCANVNYAIPRDLRSKELTLEDALKIIENKK